MYVFIVDMLETNGDFFKVMQTYAKKIMRIMIASFYFYPWYKVLVYNMPFLLRPLIAYLFAGFYAVALSRIQHNTH